MIVGVGIDIVELARLDKVYKKFGRRFLEKFLSPGELELMPASCLSFIAGRFAAKEAAVKALGTGFSQGISPGQIEVLGTGKPVLRLVRNAASKAEELGVAGSHVSISHERTSAVAVVILEAR